MSLLIESRPKAAPCACFVFLLLRLYDGAVLVFCSPERKSGKKFFRKRAACRPLSKLVYLIPFLGVTERASGWTECEISPQDRWRRASDPDVLPARRMREEYARHYTCRQEIASLEAAGLYFDSPCLANRFWNPSEVRSCLKGRRVIFLGDSLSTQQGESLVGMLGWHPEWMPLSSPRNAKDCIDENGVKRRCLLDCWHPGDGDPLRGVERCFDLYESDFAPPDGEPPGDEKPDVDISAGGGDGKEISVHMRMQPAPRDERWFERALSNYNGTRAGDVFVVNFGPHFRHTPEGDQQYKDAVFPILDEMAALKGEATVVWREVSPQHFPAFNGTYEAFVERNVNDVLCCTGTPPRVNNRNMWVENYLRDNGLADEVKVLRIYDMSLPRGGGHHTCDFSPPTTAQDRPDDDFCRDQGRTMDCTHWTEGVVEEWNSLLLNHLCPSDNIL